MQASAVNAFEYYEYEVEQEPEPETPIMPPPDNQGTHEEMITRQPPIDEYTPEGLLLVRITKASPPAKRTSSVDSDAATSRSLRPRIPPPPPVPHPDRALRNVHANALTARTLSRQEGADWHPQSGLSWRAFFMTVGEHLVKLYYPEWINLFRNHEVEVAASHTEAELLWGILVKCKQSTVPLWGQSLEQLQFQASGHSGLNCPTNYFHGRVCKSIMYMASDSFFNLKKASKGSSTCSRTLLELGKVGWVEPPWRMRVVADARLKDIIREVRAMLDTNTLGEHVTIIVGWAASDFSDCFGRNPKTTPEAVRNNFTELCMLLSQSPRSVIMLLGNAAEWRLDDRYDEWMSVCRDEASIFGILTHDLMTVIPQMRKHVSAAGYIDQWHFSCNDENKGVQAEAILLLFQTIELLRPSEYSYSQHVAHSWYCPRAYVRCQCGSMIPNVPQAKHDHWRDCELLGHLSFEEVPWRFCQPMACWSDDHCIRCGIRFVVGNIIPRAEATLQSSQLPMIGDEETAPETYAEDAIVQETVESPTLAADVDDLAVADEPAEETDTTEEAAPETHGVAPVTWLSNGVEVKMEDFDNLREACGSQSKFLRMKAENERSTALSRGTTVAPDPAENEGVDHMALDANILLALSEKEVKSEGES
jgi:hypothetical protein